MASNDSNFFSRRELVGAAMIGGASLFLGNTALGATGTPNNGGLLDVRKFGAAGDGNVGRYSPSYGIVYKGLRNCVIRDNVLHDGALKKLMVDLGGQEDGVIVGDNPGQLFAVS
ncbi:MAG: hypothetical protein WC378_01860 [Opitutaceae bacterium]|jgi:hypothetical protein